MDKIHIGADELFTPVVEETLSRQQSFGMAPPVDRVADRKAALLYRPWFVLMIAGALGGLAGWAVIEPFFDDGLRVEGRVEQITPALAGRGATLSISGVEVDVVFDQLRVLRDGRAASFRDVAPDAHVAVIGYREPERNRRLWVYQVELLAGEAPAGTVSLSALGVKDFLLSLAVFPLIAALVSLFIAAADGALSRAWRRAALCALVGLASGLALGLATSVLGFLAYTWGERAVRALTVPGSGSVVGFLAQMVSRGVAWAVTGVTMGLGQGIALRSKRLVVNGLLGGLVGALLGGLLFDPIDELVHLGQTFRAGGGELPRAVGFTVIGLTTGLMIGVVELLARDAWLKMLIGPLAGKEFVLFKNPTVIGSSPKADIYLFKDAEVEPTHALLHAMGEGYEIEDRTGSGRTFLNGRPVRRARLEHGDQLRIGRTVLSFGLKEG